MRVTQTDPAWMQDSVSVDENELRHEFGFVDPQLVHHAQQETDLAEGQESGDVRLRQRHHLKRLVQYAHLAAATRRRVGAHHQRRTRVV